MLEANSHGDTMTQPEANPPPANVPPTNLPPATPPPGSGLLGCALFAVGALVLIPSGLCTAFGGIALVMALVEDPKQIVENFGDFFPFAVITLVSLAIGVGLIWAGWRSRRS
jgi:hypothetical protein